MSRQMEEAPSDTPVFAFLKAQMLRLAGHLSFVSSDRAFLEPLVRELAGDAAGDPRALRARLIDEDQRLERAFIRLGPDYPLAGLVAFHQLSRIESDLLFLALLPELDDRFGDVFLGLRSGLVSRRPTLGIALRALLDEPSDRWRARQHLLGSALWEAGLLRRDTDDLTGLDTLLSPSAPVVAAVHGHLPERLDGGARVEQIEDGGAMRPALAALAMDLSRWIETVQVGVIHLVAELLEDARVVAAAVAGMFHRPVVRFSRLGASLEGTLRQVALCGALSPGLQLVEVERGVEALRIPASWRLQGPVLIASHPGCEVDLPTGLPARRTYLPRPRPVDQAEAWRRVLGDAGREVRVDLLANRTHLTHADLRKAAALAGQRAAASGRTAPVHSDVIGALSEAIPDPVSTLARSTRPTVPWSALVLDREVKGQLEEIIQRIEHRVTVQDRWGMSGAEGRGEGLIALFHGDSGTGKTLAVEAIATRIGLPLLRVDLSRVVSKYIGETEKHLGALFDAVEGFRATLFFDEADTLFSNRTGVKDAHDRYANLETNYLLSRLEVFEGVALMATNLLQNLDSAFTRRLQFIVHFPRPTAALQRQIWIEHLPRGQIGPDVDLDLLIRQHDLVGGEIRNAALSAAYAAATAGSSIGQPMLEQGVRSERLKRGKAIRRTDPASR